MKSFLDESLWKTRNAQQKSLVDSALDELNNWKQSFEKLFQFMKSNERNSGSAAAAYISVCIGGRSKKILGPPTEPAFRDNSESTCVSQPRCETRMKLKSFNSSETLLYFPNLLTIQRILSPVLRTYAGSLFLTD